jgi:tRNA (guanine-N7-)-methyltransferase
LKYSASSKDINESGLVASSQTGIHPHLEKCVRKHLETPWSQPLQAPTVETYRLLVNEGVFESGRKIILDSGCGTGKSTQRLAEMFPRKLVLGVDRSITRLAKSGAGSGFIHNGNCILLRAELATFWRLLLRDEHSLERHFLLYPNPWPKPGHLQRRWHGHPVWPQLLSLGGEIEMRCNWEIYAREFAQAVKIVSNANIQIRKIQPQSGISPFEKKYIERGQQLYSVKVPAQFTDALHSPVRVS